MKRLFFSLLILLLVIIGLSFTLYSERKSHKKQLDAIRIENNNLSNVCAEILSIRKKEQLLLSYDLSTISVVNKDNKNNQLSTFPIKNKLGVYFDTNMCGLCVDRTIDSLKKYVSVLGKENVFILGKGYRANFFFSGTPFKKLGILHYLSSTNCFSDFESETPMYFYVDEHNNIRYSYVVPKNIKLDFKEFIDKTKQQMAL